LKKLTVHQLGKQKTIILSKNKLVVVERKGMDYQMANLLAAPILYLAL